MEPEVEKLPQRKTEGRLRLCCFSTAECAFRPTHIIAIVGHGTTSAGVRSPVGIHLAEGGRVGLDLAIGEGS